MLLMLVSKQYGEQFGNNSSKIKSLLWNNGSFYLSDEVLTHKCY